MLVVQIKEDMNVHKREAAIIPDAQQPPPPFSHTDTHAVIYYMRSVMQSKYLLTGL